MTCCPPLLADAFAGILLLRMQTTEASQVARAGAKSANAADSATFPSGQRRWENGGFHDERASTSGRSLSVWQSAYVELQTCAQRVLQCFYESVS
jgi:hypothetical protein